jgi:hypothetical protein
VAVVVPSPLEVVGKFDLLGDRDAVLGDGGRAPALLDHDVAAFGTERGADGVGESVDAGEQGVAGTLVESDFLGGHGRVILSSGTRLARACPFRLGSHERGVVKGFRAVRR